MEDTIPVPETDREDFWLPFFPALKVTLPVNVAAALGVNAT